MGVRGVTVKSKVIPILLDGYNIFSSVMLRHMQWFEAADLIVKGMEYAITARTVTYDFERRVTDANLLKFQSLVRRLSKTCNPESGVNRNGSRWAPVFYGLLTWLRMRYAHCGFKRCS